MGALLPQDLLDVVEQRGVQWIAGVSHTEQLLHEPVLGPCLHRLDGFNAMVVVVAVMVARVSPGLEVVGVAQQGLQDGQHAAGHGRHKGSGSEQFTMATILTGSSLWGLVSFVGGE